MIDKTMSPAAFNFKFHATQLRVVAHADGVSFWIVGVDLAKALNYRDSADALRIIPAKNKGTHPVRTNGGVQNLLCVDEPGMYRLVLRSNKPEAEPFMEWVTSEVLPAIRRHGKYDPKLTVTIDALHEGEAKLKAEVARLKDELLDALRGQVKLLGRPKIKRAPVRPVTAAEARKIRDLCASGLSRSAAARQMGRSDATVSYVMRGAQYAEATA